MKTNILSLAALLIASATFVACSSDDNIINEQPANPTGKYTMTVQASKGGDATTRALTLDGKTLNATWATTENIYVKKGDTWATGSLQPQTDGTTATLKGSLSGVTIAKDDVLTLQFPRSGELDYTGQVGTLADIAAKYDYATATVTVASVSATGNINPTEVTTTFQNQQAIVKFTLVDKADGTTPLDATELIVNDGTTNYTVTPASATSEIYVAIPGISGKTVTLTATVGSDTYTYEKANVTFTNGQYYEITVKMTKEAEIEGERFTINSSGNKVVFSQGNLQATYNGSTWTWKFADHQYDYIGNQAGNTSVTNSSPYISTNATVDLFGWVGASSNFTDEAQYGITSYPASNGYGSASTESLKAEWNSTNLTITNAGGYTWRTLTGGSGGEWEWILGPKSGANPGTNCRASGATVNGTANARWTLATINTDGTAVNGMILFPDGCKISAGSATTWGAINGNSSWGTKCTTEQWTHLESLGCVFLPAAGNRFMATVSLHGSVGFYWSSTLANESYAYSVIFDSDNDMETAGRSGRNYGCSVRLVRPVE